MLTAPEIRLMVAELDGVLIGSGYARIEKGRHYLKHTHHAYLGFMYVVPEHRGKGVNKLIIDTLKNWAIAQNINELRLDVYYDNHPAIAAYEKAGFIKHMIQMRSGLATADLAQKPTYKGMSPILIVADLDRSIAFYTGVLGFRVQFRYEEFYAGIARDGYSIHIKQATPPPGERELKRSNGHVDIIFSVAGIDALYNDLSGAPLQLVQPLRDMPYGREFYVSDPDGYVIAFISLTSAYPSNS
jgi:catechol 2,3-dioxygenase-like lactoylglutathione lyase family enzyme